LRAERQVRRHRSNGIVGKGKLTTVEHRHRSTGVRACGLDRSTVNVPADHLPPRRPRLLEDRARPTARIEEHSPRQLGKLHHGRRRSWTQRSLPLDGAAGTGSTAKSTDTDPDSIRHRCSLEEPELHGGVVKFGVPGRQQRPYPADHRRPQHRPVVPALVEHPDDDSE
jgi:hypothetical protein